MKPPATDELEISAAIRDERLRFFLANRWSGPVGIFCAVSLYTAILTTTDQAPRGLSWWVIAMAMVVVMMSTAMLPKAIASKNRAGLPNVAYWSHVLAGIGFGSLFWLDLESLRTGQFRVITVALMFAVSAGVMAGLNGVYSLSRVLLVPLSLGAASGLLAANQPLLALSVAVFAGVVLRSLVEGDRLWTELIVLRARSNRTAQENLRAATHDALTGLLNRAGVMQHLAERADEREQPISLMFIDLDHFKNVNDRFGHAGGDLVLAETGARLQASLRDGDVVGRLGGDEFVVVLNASHDKATSVRLANRIIDDLELPMSVTNGDDIYLSASVGIAMLAPSEATPERLLLDADHAMYRAKKTGRRQVVHFDNELRDELHERSGLETHLRRAIRDGSIEADAQPVFILETGSIRAVELLARWRLPGGAMVPPSVFIPLAEDIGLIGDLTNHMLRTAGRMLQTWTDDPVLGDASLTVNVSPVEFVRGRLVQSVADVIAEFDIKPGRLFLEVTESHELIGDESDLMQFDALRALGVRFAIDDFGTGYSSLDQLLKLPIDVVKLDLSLMATLGSDPRQTALVRSIQSLASVVGNSVVMEGVETAAQLAELQSIGATLAQGYYLCRPVPVDELAGHVAALRSDAAALESRY